MRSTDLYVLSAISHTLADLVVDAASAEVGECCGVGYFATYGHTGSNADHVGFCDTNLNKSLRKILDEWTQFERARQVGSKYHYLVVFAADLMNAFAKSATGFFLIKDLDICQFHS